MRFLLVFLYVLSAALLPGRDEQAVDLSGRWRFAIGDNPAYSSTAFDDSGWEEIPVPGYWENSGYPGYDGIAWYRTTFSLPGNLKGKYLILMLGRIDDADQVFINGTYFNGTGSMLPSAHSGRSEMRRYPLPPELLTFGGKNSIAVRVFDQKGSGGIYDAPLGIFLDADFTDLIKQDLSGFWKFNPGDNAVWQEPAYNDTDWAQIIVPSQWEQHGHPELDGFAWYRRTFEFQKELLKHEVILALGKVNDFDQVFFNGTKIGETGSFTKAELKPHGTSIWQEERFYYIPRHLIKTVGINTIAVRVFDVWRGGGIWDGPVGITSREAYLKFLTLKKLP